MEEKDSLNITVIIAGRPYPLKIQASDEPQIRKIAKDINDKVNKYQLTYTQKDKQDFLAMAILTYAVELHKLRQGLDNQKLSDKVNKLDKLLEAVLED